MGAQQMEQQPILDGQWTGGCDSFLYPTDLAPATYAWGVNVVNRGGVVQTRPGKRRIKSFCGRIAQGHTWVRTMDDRNYEVVAVDGNVYWAAFPFTDWTQMQNVHMSSSALRMWFCTTIQAIFYDSNGDIQLLPQPRNVLFIQDGVSLPCYWQLDDFSNGVVDDTYIPGNPLPKQAMPIGTAMIWQDNRLWVAVRELVYASDFLYGASFHEESFLSEKTGFRFPRAVINLVAAPTPPQGGSSGGILVTTDSSLHGLQSFITDRTQWQNTQGFQFDVNLEIGLVAPWCIQYMHGMPWLLTARGIISYDRALTGNLSTVILTADGEMQRSKDLLAPDVTHACMGVWENILMVSVPASCVKNRHSWIMDAGIAEKLNNNAGMCWTGIWTGTYPVQFTSPIVNGTQHCYELSYSSGYLSVADSPSPMVDNEPPQAYIHLWENYVPNQIDGCETEISCSFETKAYSLTSDDYYRFTFAEFMLVNLKGIVPIQVYVIGLAGNYQKLFATTLRADIGPWGNPSGDTALYYVTSQGSTQFETYRRQVRHLRSKEWVVNEQPSDGAACVEISRLDGIDKAFQLLIQWQGRLGIRALKFFYDRTLNLGQGVCPVDESQTPHITLEATA